MKAEIYSGQCVSIESNQGIRFSWPFESLDEAITQVIMAARTMKSSSISSNPTIELTIRIYPFCATR